ncbi:DHH family phosphoesterase [Methanococcus voltae]|uniref:NanoRNase/pAp phosphatase (C-di-AMP/oligoRNAs hydrolase) n=2 Tax=Methanococcus voltae TaxID=2188 RepID=A0A8J7RM48_METVO|nr:DHH family phosphoesterase [Methanococcus voltae]MBP2172280.1 nanoRNase/pAp phosphatase (c-di-AMP/oligoRNAs hydrolase) [Methanococcus voltae]MBP2200764.1 nanoRNase/pAp phosphatase (c-di-AMP/oligoRNAs hydrolase) [Methanococcus voltae]MCS3921488.1 nanoRNase/pAp phosphatase (c-di-AMP/oligoRNAs hydrolase) [Methanococcus voltae PS]
MNNKYNIEKLKESLKSDEILFLCHHNADPDAIGACIGLRFLAEHLNKPKKSKQIVEDKIKDEKSQIIGKYKISANSISKISRNMLEELPSLNYDIEIIEYPNIPEKVFLVDTSSINQITVNEEKLYKSFLAMVDHHKKTELSTKCDFLIVNEESTSTCEMVTRILKDINLFPPKSVRTALLCGIAYDTKHLKLASEETFKMITWLIKDLNFQRILYLLSQESEKGKRIAHLKACSRMQIEEINGLIVTISNASSYEASCAKTAVSIGADLALVTAVRKRDRQIRISSRCRKSVSKKLHMGELMEEVAHKINGQGGGHAEAAGLNANWDKTTSKDEAVSKIIKICIDTIKEKLNSNE